MIISLSSLWKNPFFTHFNQSLSRMLTQKGNQLMKSHATHLLILQGMLFASTAHAYLGGFENVDGYAPFLNDVANYNAGQYGPNAGGGVFTPIAPNTGLWKKLQGPLVPTWGTLGPAYATGHQYYDRTNYGFPNLDQALIITTNADGWNAGPQEYSYSLDTYDLGGVNPASTGGDIVQISFWACVLLHGTGEGGGLGPGTIGDTISFYDSSGNHGFSIGYKQPGTTTDFAATNVGSWSPSSVAINPSAYHRWDITLDLNLQTVSIDIFEASVLTPLVTNAPLITPMNNFTEMRFLSTPGVNNAKIWALDDFGMTVRTIPEPSSIIFTAMGLLGLCLRRTRRICS